MTCGCGASCAAGVCCSSAAASAMIACNAAIMAGVIANMDDEQIQPLDILCKNCKHDSTEHDHHGCNHSEGFFHKTTCLCKHFNFDNEKLEKAKNEIIDVLFKHLKKASELQNDEAVN